MGELRGQVVVITGASSGIGEALARAYAARGASLVLLARSKERLEALWKELSQVTKVVAASCDVTRDGNLEKAFEAARREFGKIDVVIANAGFGVNGLAEELGLEDYRRQFETNVYGVLRTFKAGIEDLKKSKGHFAIIGSVSGHVSAPTVSAYSMSKFAVRALADALRVELKRYGVSVTLISPGFIASNIRRVDNQGMVHEGAKDPVPLWLQMPAAKAAKKILCAVQSRKRERILTFHGWLAVFLQNHCPGFLAWALSRSKVKTRQERLSAK